MDYPNLLVLVNSVSKADIVRHFPDYEIMTDAELFPILNGQKLFLRDSYFTHESYEELCKALEEYSKERKLIIHSFNPLIHNYLEVCEGELPDIKTDLEACARRFIIYTYNNAFTSLFEIPNIRMKMDCMSVGEAICDTYLVEAITDELVNTNNGQGL
ncbi:hypothetical protein VCHA53O466_50109 [Vibrio chagasii]|nr:hypothetical protein VCHA53O466_50109 [Vibrio chagasii]